MNYESLAEMVYKHLQEQITKGNLKSGERIKETEICKSMGISRTPIREALIKLEAEGFVQILSRRGFVVKELTLKEFKNIYSIIGCLEGYAASRAISKLTKKDYFLFRKYADNMKKAMLDKKYYEFDKTNVLFHNVYLEANENELILKTVSLLKKRIYDQRANLKIIPEWYEKVIPEHETIIKLFEKKDTNKIENYLRDVHWNFEKDLLFIKKAFLRFDPDVE